MVPISNSGSTASSGKNNRKRNGILYRLNDPTGDDIPIVSWTLPCLCEVYQYHPEIYHPEIYVSHFINQCKICYLAITFPYFLPLKFQNYSTKCFSVSDDEGSLHSFLKNL